MKRLLLIGLLLASATACSSRTTDLLSPCVGEKGSPCDRRPVNDWWMKGEKEPS